MAIEAATAPRPTDGKTTYHGTSAAVAKAAEAIVALTRSQDPRRSRATLSRDLEIAAAHLKAAMDLVDEARTGL